MRQQSYNEHVRVEDLSKDIVHIQLSHTTDHILVQYISFISNCLISKVRLLASF